MGEPADHPGRYRHGLLIALALSGCGRVSFDAKVDGSIDVGGDAFVCATSVGHDEDGDLIDDGCDLCPVTNATDNRDTDNDGVGDLCDREPASANQTRIMFEPFLAPDAQWSIQGVEQTDSVRMTGGNLWYPLGFDSIDVTVSGELKSIDAQTIHQFFVSADRVVDDNSWYAELVDDGIDRRFSLMHRELGTYTNVGNFAIPAQVPLGRVTLQMSTDVVTRAATAKIEIGSFSATVSGTYVPDISSAERIRVFVDGYTIDIGSFFVVATAMP